MIRILLFFLCLVVFQPHFAVAADSGFKTSAKQAIMIDFETGMVLFQKNADQRMPTSSMSKVMTVYMVFDALKAGQIKLDDKFTVSEKAWRKGGSKMFVEVDKRVKVEDLLRGVIVQSGNDAAIALAEGLAGSEEAFADALNKKASELSMENSHFANASGWPDQDHYSTARDMAILSYNLINNFPEYYHYFSEKEFSFNNIKQSNRNPLLYRDMGADGIKTGHTEDGGYGLMASGTYMGRRVILVVNGLKDEKARAQESAKLLEWGLRGFKNHQLFSEGEVIDTADVIMGKSKKVSLVAERDLLVTVPVISRNDLKVQVKYNTPLRAPIQKGQKIGIIEVEIPGFYKLEVDALAGEDVPVQGFFARTLGKAKLFFLASAGA